MSFSTHHIDYIERAFLDNASKPAGVSPDELYVLQDVKLLRVSGVASFWKGRANKVETLRILMEDFCSGLYGEGLPLIYMVECDASEIRLSIGTTGQSCLSVLLPSLESAYPGIELANDDSGFPERLKGYDRSCMVVGTPTLKIGDENVGIEQIERLIRGRYGDRWMYLVVAVPMDREEVTGLYSSVLNELRIIRDTTRSTSSKNPVVERYEELVTVLLKKIETGKTCGMWHTSVYFLTQGTDGLEQAGSILKAVFGGRGSLPDPVKVIECGDSIPGLAQITTPAPEPPGKIHYPGKYLSILNSRELTAFVHLPTEERPGYFVKDSALFDVAISHTDQTDSVELGEVTDRGTSMGYPYRVKTRELTKHTLIAGTTGSGKTNTIFHLLRQLWQKGIPFLVIEPAKTEYRKLLHTELGSKLNVFTPGVEMLSPFRLNPFQIIPGTSVQAHIDRLRAVFDASFIMYAPMPYVLERCMYEVYRDRGWNMTTSENTRGSHCDASPTLTDLYEKIDQVTESLGYERKITMDVKAALKTRINSLRIGGKGLMLDTRNSIPMEELLSRPTVIELEHIGNDDEKAFLIGLLLIFLYEHYTTMTLKEGTGLKHVTVVEEAHRLFRSVPEMPDTEVANMKGKAVETFCNILSEIRAYGEGFIIAEQIPSKLSADVLKNTNLKVFHRTVALDDRTMVGTAMNMDEDQMRFVASLDVGECVVYGTGDDRPLLVRVPYSKVMVDERDETELIKQTATGVRRRFPELFLPYRLCAPYCREPCRYRKEAEGAVEEGTFMEGLARLILSAVVSHGAIEKSHALLLEQAVNRFRSVNDSGGFVYCALITGIHRYFDKRGQQYGWSYDDTQRLQSMFAGYVLNLLSEKSSENTLEEFARTYMEMCRVGFMPFSGCRMVCSRGLCLYRYNVEPLLHDNRIDRNFLNAMAEGEGVKLWEGLAGVCKSVVRRVVVDDIPEEEKNRVAMCFVIQKCESMPYMDYFLTDRIVTRMKNLFDGGRINGQH